MSFIKYIDDIKIGNFEFFQQSKLGIFKPRAPVDSLINKFSNVYTASVMIGVRRDDFSFSIGIPDTIINGNMNLHTPTGRRSNGEYTYQDYKIDLRQNPSVEYAINYKNIRLGIVDNAYGTDEIYILTKTKIQF